MSKKKENFLYHALCFFCGNILEKSKLIVVRSLRQPGLTPVFVAVHIGEQKDPLALSLNKYCSEPKLLHLWWEINTTFCFIVSLTQIPILAGDPIDQERCVTSTPFWEACRLQVWILLIRQRHGSRFGHFLLVLIEQFLVDLNLRRSESGRSDELKLRVAD